MEDGNVVNTVGVDYEPTSVSIHPSKTEFAVGGSLDTTLHVFSLAAGGNFEEKKVGKSWSLIGIGVIGRVTKTTMGTLERSTLH